MSVWSKLKGALGRGDKPGGEALIATARFQWSRNMLLRVAAPQGPGWELSEGGASGNLLSAFRCTRGEGADALVLHAKLFDAPEKQKNAKELAGEDWKDQWLTSTFADIEEVSAEVVGHMIDGFREEACEVCVLGRGRPPFLALFVRERQLPAKDKLLVLTAAGSPAQHEAHARVIEAWMANSTHAA